MKKIFLPTIVAIAPIQEVSTINQVFHPDLLQTTIGSKQLKLDDKILDEYKNKKLTKNEVRKKVIAIVSNLLGVKKIDLTTMTDFTELGADSLDVVEIIIEFEKEFSIVIPDIVAEKMSNIESGVDFIYELLQESVLLFSDFKFKGKVLHVGSNYSGYQSRIIKGGLSSIIVPKGYRVALFTELKFEGSKILIDASKKRIKIKKMSRIRRSKWISRDKDLIDWNDKIKSIVVERLK